MDPLEYLGRTAMRINRSIYALKTYIGDNDLPDNEEMRITVWIAQLTEDRAAVYQKIVAVRAGALAFPVPDVKVLDALRDATEKLAKATAIVESCDVIVALAQDVADAVMI